jgi:hypothetical protein
MFVGIIIITGIKDSHFSSMLSQKIRMDAAQHLGWNLPYGIYLVVIPMNATQAKLFL